MTGGVCVSVWVHRTDYSFQAEIPRVSINILDMVKSQIGGQIAGQIAGKFGVNEQTAKSGIDALLPTILGGLVSKVSSPGGTEALGKALDEGGFDGGLLDNLGGLLSGSKGDELANKGGGLVSMIFGDKAAVLGPIIAKLTGMKSDSVMSMLAMLAPLVMSFLGKAKSTSGMDVNGLASLLVSQKSSIASAMPAGVSDAMGLGLLSPKQPAAAAAPVRPTQASEAGGGGILKVLIPLAILAAIGYGCYRYIVDGIRPSGPEGNVIVEMDPNAANDGGYGPEGGGDSGLGAGGSGEGETMRPYRPQPGDSSELAPKVATETTEPAAAMPDFDISKMTSTFESMAGVFEKVTDVESAKAALPELETMDKQLEAASAGFAAIPELIRGPLVKSLQSSFPAVEAMIEKALAVPGVGDVLKPIVESMMLKIKPLIDTTS